MCCMQRKKNKSNKRQPLLQEVVCKKNILSSFLSINLPIYYSLNMSDPVFLGFLQFKPHQLFMTRNTALDFPHAFHRSPFHMCKSKGQTGRATFSHLAECPVLPVWSSAPLRTHKMKLYHCRCVQVFAQKTRNFIHRK